MKGSLVIADISGYTAFLNAAELEHAQGILEGLINRLIRALDPPFRIAKLEGDAVFCHAPDGSMADQQSLLDAVEAAYVAFADERDYMARNMHCLCTACSLVATLDLKFAVHHGDYIVGKLGGRSELTGADVITVHRLLKNSIPEATGCKAYAFFSQSLPLAETDMVAGMHQHTESYQHIGEVRGHVHDLAAVLERERARNRIVVDREDAWLAFEKHLPVPPGLAWHYLTAPEHRELLLGADSLTEDGVIGSRRGVGTVQHCIHSGGSSNHAIVDWHPFESVTFEIALPFGGRQQYTVVLEPEEEGTRVSCVMGRATAGNLLVTGFLRGAMIRMKGTMRRDIPAGMDRVVARMEADRDAGLIVVMEPEAPILAVHRGA